MAMEHLLAYFQQNYGSRTKLAARLKITPSAITQWRAVPPEHVLDVEDMTGISRHLLRPDVFGAAEAAA